MIRIGNWNHLKVAHNEHKKSSYQTDLLPVDRYPVPSAKSVKNFKKKLTDEEGLLGGSVTSINCTTWNNSVSTGHPLEGAIIRTHKVLVGTRVFLFATYGDIHHAVTRNNL
ncbi:hypothetical protein TYRP_008209 [Tyrophagus putrescentiae]|nr:hypothetical protein TYRP_008209 [Tyrophagus putrescentiae]